MTGSSCPSAAARWERSKATTWPCWAAQCLSAEADRMLETVSQAEGIRRLLEADRVLERGLSRTLCSELALADYLSAQRAGHCR